MTAPVVHDACKICADATPVPVGWLVLSIENPRMEVRPVVIVAVPLTSAPDPPARRAPDPVADTESTTGSSVDPVPAGDA